MLIACGTGTNSANTYTKSVTAVDESGVARTLKTISTAQATFAISHSGEYGSFEDLTGSALLDERFSGHTPETGGYVYTMRLSPSSGGQAAMYAVNADPKTPASGIQTAGRHFYLDSTSAVIHANSSQPASASDPAFP
jgi:hypothetical protein